MENETHVKKAITKGNEVQKSPFKRALSVFLADDLDSVKDSIIDDYIKPRMKDFKKEAIRKFKEFMVDSIQGCVEMLIIGKTSKRRRSSYYDDSGKPVQYFRMYDKKSDARSSKNEPYDERFALTIYKIDDYAQAVEVRDALKEVIDRYTVATVADYYMLVDAGPRACDHNYGWLDLENVEVISSGDGDGTYIIDLPRPIPLPRKN